MIGSKTQTITGLVERASVKDFERTRYYFARVNGQLLQATDHAMGADMLSSIGQAVTVTVEASAKPGCFYVRSFAPFNPTPKKEEPLARLKRKSTGYCFWQTLAK
jgi:hypothetical protein